MTDSYRIKRSQGKKCHARTMMHSEADEAHNSNSFMLQQRRRKL
jgi:hypothetical protein